MKKIISMGLVVVFIMLTICALPANAAEKEMSQQIVSIEELGNGYYIETVIEDVPTIYATNTITKTKTAYVKHDDNTVLCSLSITATFKYDGSTSSCTSCSHSSTAPGSTWSVKNASSSRSGNSATATATAVHDFGIYTAEYPMSVKITCSANGTIS